MLCCYVFSLRCVFLQMHSSQQQLVMRVRYWYWCDWRCGASQAQARQLKAKEKGEWKWKEGESAETSATLCCHSCARKRKYIHVTREKSHQSEQRCFSFLHCYLAPSFAASVRDASQSASLGLYWFNLYLSTILIIDWKPTTFRN